MIKLIKYIRPYVLLLLGSIALLFLQANCDLALPDYMADIVNTGVMSGNTDYIITAGVKMIAVALLGTAAAVTVGYLAAWIGAGVAHDLRSDVFKMVESFAHAEFDKFSTASLITRTTNDITQIQTVLIMMIRLVFYAPIMGVGGIVKAIRDSGSMTWIIAVAVFCLIGIIVALFTLVIPRFKLVQKLVDRLNLVTRENLEGMLVIRAFNTQAFELKRFDKANQDLTETNLFVARAMQLMMPAMMLIMNLTMVFIVWIGANEISKFQMNLGDMMAYMQYAMQIIMAFLMMSLMFIMFPRAAVSADRVAEILAEKASILDPAKPVQFDEPFEPVIEFSHVDFKYPGGSDDVLHDISFTALPGQTTAIIGSTGSGKSTLINLILRFYDVNSGSVRVNGKDIRSVTRHDLREKIGYVPQKSVLFSGTIESNLVYGDKSSSGENTRKAATIAQATEFIDSKDDGYQSTIAQGGTNVSGGQKQRLSIGRALVKNAPIYLFDDSFSALDLKTDRNLRAALKKETGDSTIILVAQRVGTIMNADQILVMENGALVGKGTHQELLKTCAVYREIAYSQLSEEELAV